MTTLALEQLLYEHREGALTCYDHPGSSLIKVWCCVCGEHNLTETWRHHVARHITDLVVTPVSIDPDVEYAVQVRNHESWRVRFGWFRDYDGGDIHTGKERAQNALPYALNEGYEEVRIVSRSSVVQVLSS